MDLIGNIGLGLSTALVPENLFYCFLGVFLGMVVGVLPGIGALAAISMLFPITFHLDATPALIMLAGLFYGTAYGGSTAAILLNVPGTPSGAVAALDGYPMSKQGRGGVALFLTTIASFIGGSIGIIIMMLFSPIIQRYALDFSAQEYFSLMLLGLVAASTMSTGSPVKSIAMVILGLLIGSIGFDVFSGVGRLNFGLYELYTGVSIIAVTMGVFGIGEIIRIANEPVDHVRTRQRVTFRSMIPTRDDVKRSIGPTLRGSLVGSFFGALPGTGALIASYMAYSLETKVSKNPSKFGTGIVEGVTAPEASNNAADQTAFIPTLTLGIPGSATMALMLGVLMINGIAPGPQLITNEPDLFWGLVMSFWIGNVILVVLNIPFIGLWVRLLQVPFQLLFPIILVLICIGAFSVHNTSFDIWMVAAFGVLGYAMQVFRYPAAPLILGFVLGPMMEENFRRSMVLARGDMMTFFERPISAVVMVVTVGILVWSLSKSTQGILKARQARANAAQSAE
ncbi:tripartite tricarboxylate transporter permease [Aliihoeflea sp. PC F10.4]